MQEKAVLLAEDDASHEEFFRRAVTKSGVPCRLDVVRDGVETIDYLFCIGQYKDRDAEGMPDLIFLDLRMPKMDGLQVLQVLRRVRGDGRPQFPPVVVLTSSDSDRDITEAYQQGAQSYICKPLEIDKFNRAVRDALEYWLGLNQPIPKEQLAAQQLRDKLQVRDPQPVAINA